jgi:hypothetical protein
VKTPFLFDFIFYVELTNINTFMNKYEKYYHSIINNRKSNPTVNEYTETHHILPRSLGGSDDATNLVELTAREHFVCHWLLTKMYTGAERGKMINALWMMQGQSIHQKRYETKITSRVYENLRKEYSEHISKMNTGRIQPLEEKQRQRAAQIGRKRNPFSNEWKENLSKNHKSKKEGFDGAISLETRKKIGDKIRGRKMSEEEKIRRGLANKGKKREKIPCPHCEQMISVNTYPRWHGDNCKFK